MLDLALQKTVKGTKKMSKNKNLNQVNGWPYLIDLSGKHRKVNMDHVLYVEPKTFVIDEPIDIDPYKGLISTLQEQLGFTGFHGGGRFTFDKSLEVETLAFNLDNNEVIEIFSSAKALSDN